MTEIKKAFGKETFYLREIETDNLSIYGCGFEAGRESMRCRKINIFYCEDCDKYFEEDDIIATQPDGGHFCPDCRGDHLNCFTTEKEIVFILNEENNK